MKKNVILVVALFALMAVGVSAQTGTVGLAYASIDNGAAYSVSKGTVTTGAVVILASYNNKPVTTIAESAFSNSSIDSVTIPNSIKSINRAAFFGCTKLTSITIPSNVVIGYNAFASCSSLTSVTFQGMINFGGFDNNAFGQPHSLRDVFYATAKTTGTAGTYTKSGSTWTLITAATTAPAQTGDPESDFQVTKEGNAITITEYVGKNTVVNIPSRIQNLPVTKIGDVSFYSQTSLTSVTIPNGVTSIGGEAFWGCTSLTSVTIPNSVKSIGMSAFRGCSNLTSVTFGGTIPSDDFSSSSPFPGDLRAKFYATDKANGTPGTYTKSGNTWTKK